MKTLGLTKQLKSKSGKEVITLTCHTENGSWLMVAWSSWKGDEPTMVRWSDDTWTDTLEQTEALIRLKVEELKSIGWEVVS